MTEMRVFLASRRSSGELEIAHMNDLATKSLRLKLPAEVTITITTSDQCHLQNFSRLGGWPAWIEWVATGIRYDDRTPVYNLYVLYETDLGRANADIFKKALQAGKLCLFMDPQSGDLSYVDSILDVDPNNWKSGWAAIIR